LNLNHLVQAVVNMSSKTKPKEIIRKGTPPKKIHLKNFFPEPCDDILMAVAEELEAKFPSLQRLKPVIEYEFLGSCSFLYKGSKHPEIPDTSRAFGPGSAFVVKCIGKEGSHEIVLDAGLTFPNPSPVWALNVDPIYGSRKCLSRHCDRKYKWFPPDQQFVDILERLYDSMESYMTSQDFKHFFGYNCMYVAVSTLTS